MDERRGTQARYRVLVEQSPDAILVVRDGRVVFANPRGLSLLGAASLDDLTDEPPLAFVPTPEQPRVIERHARLLAGDDRVRAVDHLVALDGSVLDVDTSSVAIDDEGRPAVLVVVRDGGFEAAGPRLAEELRTAEQRFTEAFRLAPTGMLLLDEQGDVLDANAAAAGLAGVDREELIGRPSLRLLHPEDRALVRSWLRKLALDSAEAVTGERRIVRPDGSVAWVQSSMARLPGEPPTYVVHLVDVTERRETEARLAHQALHDPLTALPNRALLFDRLAQAVRAAVRGGDGVTVLYLDLDNFKTINDTYGHATGDRVLIEVAARLSAADAEMYRAKQRGGSTSGR